MSREQRAEAYAEQVPIVSVGRSGHLVESKNEQVYRAHIAGAQEEAAIKDAIIAELQKKCRAADEVIGFYAGKSIWGNSQASIDPCDTYLCELGILRGGKRARQFQRDYPKTE